MLLWNTVFLREARNSMHTSVNSWYRVPRQLLPKQWVFECFDFRVALVVKQRPRIAAPLENFPLQTFFSQSYKMILRENDPNDSAHSRHCAQFS